MLISLKLDKPYFSNKINYIFFIAYLYGFYNLLLFAGQLCEAIGIGKGVRNAKVHHFPCQSSAIGFQSALRSTVFPSASFPVQTFQKSGSSECGC